MKVLTVGDLHNVPSEMADSQNLIDFVIEIAIQEKVDQILFMGDLYHFHNIIRAESLYFWRNTFRRLKGEKIEVKCLVGNHDLNSESGDPKIHALLAHEEQVEVIDEVKMEEVGIIYAPYMHDKNLFIESLKSLRKYGSPVVFCHQSFTGAKFDNGFYDPHGIDLEFIGQKEIVSGHIHTPQKFSKVEYIGAPRWRTISDANIQRNIVLFEIQNDGIVNRKYFNTGTVCKQIIHHIDTEDAPFDINLINSKDDFRVDIKGTEAYIEKRKKELSGFPLKFRTIKVLSKEIVKIKESDGIKVAFGKYLSTYKPKHGTDINLLRRLSNERLGI